MLIVVLALLLGALSKLVLSLMFSSFSSSISMFADEVVYPPMVLKISSGLNKFPPITPYFLFKPRVSLFFNDGLKEKLF